MPAPRHRSLIDRPAAAALASISAADKTSDMAQCYLQNSTRVKSNLATRLSAPESAFINAAMTAERALVREFVERAAEAMGTDYTGIARKAGLAPSTITRFMRDTDAPILTTRTLGKIAQAAGIPLPSGSVGTAPDEMRLSVLRAVADALGIDISTAALSDREREWLAVVKAIPPTIENQAFDLVRGISETTSPPQQEGGPGKSSSARSKGKPAA